MNMNIKEILNKAFNLGQTYWQQADSEYVSHNKKADSTLSKFQELSLSVEIDVNQAKFQMDALLEALQNLSAAYELLCHATDENPESNAYYCASIAAIAATKGEV
jgi:hypothetical protein